MNTVPGDRRARHGDICFLAEISGYTAFLTGTELEHARAEGGEILIPEPVRHLLAGKSFTFADRGEFVMKGFDDAVRLYEVRWREEARRRPSVTRSSA